MNLPKDFENYFLRVWEKEDVETLTRGLEAEPSVSIRLNTRRLPADAEPRGADSRVPWCPEGIYLKERPSFTADPLLHAGAYYVQEASSMFLAHVLRSLQAQSFIPNHPLDAAVSSNAGTPEVFKTALDLCAAPGGKSTLLRSLLPDDCLLVSNEPNRARCQVLAENLAKWGHPNVQVTQAFAADLAQAAQSGSPFSLILADVPCSGEGMMRKEPEAVAQWSPAFVAECAALQRSIVGDIWPALQPGGILIYSTCTFNPEEDEENVEWIVRELGADVLSVPVDPAWNIRGDLRNQEKNAAAVPDDSPLPAPSPLPCYHFLPGAVRGEGFFLAVLRKHGSSAEGLSGDFADEGSSPSPKKKSKKKKDRTPKGPAFPILPTNQLDQEGAPRVDLSLADSIRYLQREALVLPPDTPRGIVQVCYAGQRLGLMNNLGSRANNLYPKEWRIRSGYVSPASLFDSPSK